VVGVVGLSRPPTRACARGRTQLQLERIACVDVEGGAGSELLQRR
jgi:hypothetical protein